MRAQVYVYTPASQGLFAVKKRWVWLRGHAKKSFQTARLLHFPISSCRRIQKSTWGGHGLYSTVGDYCRFIRMWLNNGAGESGQVLKAETVSAAVANGLGDMKIKRLPGVIPTLSNDAEFFPGMPKSWCYTFMINDEEAPTGRPAGALGWAGLANLFYWIDRKNGLGGYWATQILPFGDPVSFTGYMDFETAAYQSVAPKKAA